MDRKTTQRAANRRRPTHKKQRTETVYTEAKPVNISRFIVRIATVVAIVLAVIFSMSIFFKADKIEVAGANKYAVAQIQEASKIMNGSNLLTLNKAQIASRILSKLPYISEVRIGIRLPDTVIIEVKETEVAYAVQCEEDIWWLISCEGKVLEKIDAAVSSSHTRILGVRLENPQVGESAVASEMTDIPAVEAETPVTVYGRERLSAALQIAKEMETNGVLGTLATINVKDMSDIELWYANRFQIHLGDSKEIPSKVFSVVQAINQLSQYDSGILDASFTTWPDDVYYKSFN